MRNYDIPAIVFGGGRNGLAVARNLGRSGIDVYCVLDQEDAVRHSRFCKKCFVIPHIQESEIVLRRFLSGLKGKFNDYAVLFSTSDLYSLHLSYLKDELGGNYYVPLASYEVVRKLVCKKEFYKSLTQYSVPHPVTFFPESLKDVQRISKEINYPVFIKPSMSQIFWGRFHQKGFIGYSKEDLVRYFLLAVNSNIEVMLQEIIPGLAAKNVFGIEAYFNKKHDPAGSFAWCRLRGWPPMFGNTCLRESISMSEIAFPYDVIRTYLRQLGYYGLMEAEWKVDSRDNTFKVLEVNARQSMQSCLPTRCGINLILMSYLDAIGQKADFSASYKENVLWMDFVSDMRSAIETRTSVKDWLATLKRVKEWSFFATDDLKPWIANNFESTRNAVSQLTRRAFDLA